MVGGKCFGVFCSITCDLSNGTWIIAIGHHLQKLGRQLCFSVSLSVCYADFSNFAEGYRLEFSKYQAEIRNRQSWRSNLKSWMELGGWDPPKGLFCPLKTPQLTKKLQLTTRSCVEHIPHGQTKFLVKKFWTRDTPKWNYWPKCSEEFRENGRVNSAGAKPLPASVGRSVGRASLYWP